MRDVTAREVDSGRLTASKLDDFRGIVRKAIREHLREYLNAHLKKAMDRITEDSSEPVEITQTEHHESDEDCGNEHGEITENEEEALRIIKAILAREIKAERLSLRPGKAYKTVLLDEKPRCRIALLKFRKRKKVVEILDAGGTRAVITEVDGIYEYADQLRSALELQSRSD